MDRDTRHLSEDAFQGFLDGSLPDTEATRVREHVDGCARCRSELEGWQVLFHELGDVGDLEPSAGFADRVMTALPRPEPEPVSLAARIGAVLRRGRRRAAAVGHLSADAIQDLLDDALPRPKIEAAEAHLHGCRLCRDEVDVWRGVMARLDDVPPVAPAAGFTERVMAHVRIQNALAVAQPTLGERLAARLDALSPRTRKRVTGLAGAAVTPVATLALVLYAVFSHPLVTVGNLLTFLWLETQEAAGSLLAATLGETLEAGLLGQALEVAGSLAASPGAAALAFATFSLLTVAAAWVLYRNLIVTQTVDERYAHASF